MSKDWEHRVETIERVTQTLNGVIAHFIHLRDLVALLDEEYASYLEHYRSYYTDDPLPIRQYYERMAELEAINALFVGSAESIDFEALYQKHKHRIQYLERVLAA
jgi:hypothetical protein